MVTYSPNIPQPGDFPSESQPLLLANNQYLLGTPTKGLLRDHNMTLDTANAADGVHKQVTFYQNAASPLFAGGVSVLYANTGSSQSQLWFDNGTVNTQLTVTKASVPSLNVGPPAQGVSFLPGGFLIQWGATQNGSNLTTYPVAFSGNPYSITLTQIGTTYTQDLAVTALNPAFTSFTAGIAAGTFNIPYYWLAIGPA